MFVLNPNGEALDDTLYTLDLGAASAEVYVIATAGNYHMDPQVEHLRDAAADGRSASAQADHEDLIADKLMTDGPRGWPGRGRTCTRCPCSTTARSRRTRTCTPRSGATPEPSA